MRLFCLLYWISSACIAQVNSVEILTMPGFQASNGYDWPSFSEQNKRLCFAKKENNDVTIMVAELLASGSWSQPHVAFTLSKKDLLEGLSFSSSGNRIYIGLNNDIYFIDYLGGTAWSIPLKMSPPISTKEYGEHQPSILENDQELCFLRGVKDSSRGDWSRKIFYSKKDLTWSVPKMIDFKNIDFDQGEFFRLRVLSSGTACLLSTSVIPSAHNYIGQLKNGTFSNFKEINFSGSTINWISRDFSFGFGQTYTNPSKLIKINFDSNWFINQPNEKALESSAQRNTADTDLKTQLVKPLGKYYGLLIGVSQYQDSRLNLDKPLRDALQLADILTTHYSFDRKDITVLSNPTRQAIMSELYKLRSVVTSNDNLLIFFAGHGFWDESIKQGYWWPTDAEKNNPSFWLSNSDLREQIRGINSAHTLLVSDACFSGGIFKTRDASDLTKASLDIQVLYKTRSRRAITSGNLSTVPDQSVFFEYLNKKLLTNEEKFMPAQKLFFSLKTAVISNSMIIPQEGIINEAGDEGGDFIFIKK